MTVQTTAGTILSIMDAAPSSFTKGAYQALFGTSVGVVGEIVDLGEFGREYQLVTHNPIATRGTQKFKGSFNEGSMTLQLAVDMEDDGQKTMLDALDSDDDYSFEVVFQNGDTAYFQAKVMSYKIGAGTVDSMLTATCQLELTTAKDGTGIIWDLYS